VKAVWDAWNSRSLADEPIVRLILDGTVVRARLDRKATSISLLVVLGVRADGQKVLLAMKDMGGESAEAWRSVLGDLTRRGLQRKRRSRPTLTCDLWSLGGVGPGHQLVDAGGRPTFDELG